MKPDFSKHSDESTRSLAVFMLQHPELNEILDIARESGNSNQATASKMATLVNSEYAREKRQYNAGKYFLTSAGIAFALGKKKSGRSKTATKPRAKETLRHSHTPMKPEHFVAVLTLLDQRPAGSVTRSYLDIHSGVPPQELIRVLIFAIEHGLVTNTQSRGKPGSDIYEITESGRYKLKINDFGLPGSTRPKPPRIKASLIEVLSYLDSTGGEYTAAAMAEAMGKSVNSMRVFVVELFQLQLVERKTGPMPFQGSPPYLYWISDQGRAALHILDD